MKAIIDSVWAEAGLILALVANTLLLVSVTGPKWAEPTIANTTLGSLGLWKACSVPAKRTDLVTCKGLGPYNLPSWFTATQALFTTSVSGLLLAFVVLILFACVQRFKEDRRLLLVYDIITVIFGTLGMAGVILFGERIGELIFQGTRLHVAWSFIVGSTGIGIHVCCVLLTVVELIVGSRRSMNPSETTPVIANAAAMATSEPPVSMETVA